MNCQCGATPDLFLNVSSSFNRLIPVFVHPDLMDWDFTEFLDSTFTDHLFWCPGFM